MYKFCVKTGILFLILCGVSGLPYLDKKIENEDSELDNELSGSEVKLLNRLRRAPHYPVDMSLESRFGGPGPPFGGPHGPLGYGHPWGPQWGPPGHRHESWRYNGPPPGCKHPFVGGDGYPHDHPDPNVPFEHSPEWHKNHPHFGHPPHHKHGNPYQKHDGYPYHPDGYPHNNPDHHHQDPSIQHGHNNIPSEPNNIPSEPTEANLPEPKLNNDDSTNIRPVSEPNFDVAPQNNVTTPYPQIDIRLGA